MSFAHEQIDSMDGIETRSSHCDTRSLSMTCDPWDPWDSSRLASLKRDRQKAKGAKLAIWAKKEAGNKGVSLESKVLLYAACAMRLIENM